MGRDIHRKPTPSELVRIRRARTAFEADKDRIVAEGRAVFERHEQLRDMMRMLQTERERPGAGTAYRIDSLKRFCLLAP